MLDKISPFVEAVFPLCVGPGTSGGPGFRTQLFMAASGSESRTAAWETLRARYTVAMPYATPDQVEQVLSFFYVCRGQSTGFLYKDWSDYQIINQAIATSDGETLSYPIFKRYRSGRAYFDRRIYKPLVTAVTAIAVQGNLKSPDTYTINSQTGILTFNETIRRGNVISVAYMEFFVPVRFADDALNIAQDEHDQYSISGLNLVEVIPQ